MLRSVKKKGFTLLELLIVIVVIGVLAAMMLMASSEMESTARATKIINDLKQLETAVMSWYWDNYGTLALSDKNGYTVGGNSAQNKEGVAVDGIQFHVQKDNTIITKYLGNPNFSLNEGNSAFKSEAKDGLFAKLNGYSVYAGNSNYELYVFYRLSNDSTGKDNARLREKLKGRAKSAKLVTYMNGKYWTYDGANVVGKLVMVFDESKRKK